MCKLEIRRQKTNVFMRIAVRRILENSHPFIKPSSVENIS